MQEAGAAAAAPAAANGGVDPAPEAEAASVAGSGSAAGADTASPEWSWTAGGWKQIPVASIGSGTLRAWNATRGWFNYSDNEDDPWARWQP